MTEGSVSTVQMRITLKYRVRDKHARILDAQARAVNFVWNYCNETQQKVARAGRKWLTGYDLEILTAGSTKEGLNLHSHTVQRICNEYDKCRRQQRKPWLRWRGRKSLGWVPFSAGHVSLRDGGFVFRGQRYDVWLHRRPPAGVKFGAGSFNADSRGRWYINIPVVIEACADTPCAAVGIDLGLKDLATLSTGEKIAAPRLYRATEAKMGLAQQRGQKRRARSLHAKVHNQRKDMLHKASARIAKSFGLIVVGDVNPSKLAKTSMAKSVLDAGWSSFKNMLAYKSIRNGAIFLEVNEAYSTQACSGCGSIAGPKGRAGLNERTWSCGCGLDHDRDVNAALNILRAGHRALAEGAST